MATLVDVVNALRELIEITKRVEKNTEEIKELKKGQEAIVKRLENLEDGQKEILTRLDVWERLSKLEEKLGEVDKLSQIVAKLEERAKT